MTQASWTIEEFKVTSYGNGTSYLVQEARTGREFSLQGYEAANWRTEYDYHDERGGLAEFLRNSMCDYN